MRRLAIVSTHQFCAYSALRPARRWKSHSSSSLTDEALLEKIDARLNQDDYGEKIAVDAKKKLIKAANTELPLSPIFDPSWIRSRRRKTKPPPSRPNGFFQRRFRNNPFAHALATPLRYCPFTKTIQPRYFLQQFDVVSHPQTNEGWLVPNNRDFCHVQMKNEEWLNSADSQPQEQDKDDTLVPDTELTRNPDTDGLEEPEPQILDYTAPSPSDASAADTESNNPNAYPTREPRAQIQCYTVAQKSIMDELGSRKKLRGCLLVQRSGMSANSKASFPVWRYNMGSVILEQMRQEVTSQLIYRAGIKDEQFVQPCSSWDEIKHVDRLGCILWLPQSIDETTPRQYATFDIPDFIYNTKLCVHNLVWLLGEQAVATMRAESSAFRDHDVLVLKRWRSKTMQQLHLLLWKLQGYLDVP